MNICILGGYIVGVSDSCGVSIDKETENTIKEKFNSKPEAELGRQWMLNYASMEWELVELSPVEPEHWENEAVVDDYQKALSDLGVTVDEEE